MMKGFLICFLSVPVVLLLTTGCREEKSWVVPGSRPKSVSLEERMHMFSPGLFVRHLGISFRCASGGGGTVYVNKNKELADYEVAILIGDDPAVGVEIKGIDRVLEIGTVDLYGDGSQAVLVVGYSVGTGSHTTMLHLINPRLSEAVEMSLTFSHQRTQRITEVSTSKNFHDARFTTERRFLDEVKYKYGCVDEQLALEHEDDLDFAAYFWARANGGIDDGRMTLRRLPGHHPDDASVTARLRDGQVIYTAYFKGAVWGYDASSDESFVLFHPRDMYNWPVALKQSGDWLLILTGGEGCALVNLRSAYLKRVVDVKIRRLSKFVVRGNKAVIDDAEIELPSGSL
ncbi:MAG: hypothetical protein ACYTF6_06390 [Planctomycetota bacterium]|jgi:hypothetical protein